jgi:hypothetical protein
VVRHVPELLVLAALTMSCAGGERARVAGAPESPEQARARMVAEVAEWAELYLTPEDVERLGLSRAALDAHPPGAKDVQDAAAPVIRAGRAEAERCLPDLVRADGTSYPMRAFVSFVLAPDGQVLETRTDLDLAQDAGEDRCLKAVIARWRFQPVGAGGQLLVKFDGTGPQRPAPAYPQNAAYAAYATEGYTAPRMKRSSCVQQRLVRASARVRPFTSSVRGAVVAKFAVGPDGTPSRFQMMTDAPLPVGREIKRAVLACEWEPGRDPEGTPAAIWVILPFRFG